MCSQRLFFYYLLFNYYLLHLQRLMSLPRRASVAVKTQSCEFSNQMRRFTLMTERHYLLRFTAIMSELNFSNIQSVLLLHQHLSTSIDFSFTTSNYLSLLIMCPSLRTTAIFWALIECINSRKFGPKITSACCW